MRPAAAENLDALRGWPQWLIRFDPFIDCATGRRRSGAAYAGHEMSRNDRHRPQLCCNPAFMPLLIGIRRTIGGIGRAGFIDTSTCASVARTHRNSSSGIPPARRRHALQRTIPTRSFHSGLLPNPATHAVQKRGKAAGSLRAHASRRI